MACNIDYISTAQKKNNFTSLFNLAVFSKQNYLLFIKLKLSIIDYNKYNYHNYYEIVELTASRHDILYFDK